MEQRDLLFVDENGVVFTGSPVAGVNAISIAATGSCFHLIDAIYGEVPKIEVGSRLQDAQFAFDEQAIGELRINMKVVDPVVLSSALQTERDLALKWNIDPVGASQETWPFGEPADTAAGTGFGSYTEVLFRGLPARNADFGKKKVSLLHFGTMRIDTDNVFVFFSKNAHNHPAWGHVQENAMSYAGTANASLGDAAPKLPQEPAEAPNWFYYWIDAIAHEASATTGFKDIWPPDVDPNSLLSNVRYDATYPLFASPGINKKFLAETNWDFWTQFVGPADTVFVYDLLSIGGSEDTTIAGDLGAFAGISQFLESLVHEGWHVEQDYLSNHAPGCGSLVALTASPGVYFAPRTGGASEEGWSMSHRRQYIRRTGLAFGYSLQFPYNHFIDKNGDGIIDSGESIDQDDDGACDDVDPTPHGEASPVEVSHQVPGAFQTSAVHFATRIASDMNKWRGLNTFNISSCDWGAPGAQFVRGGGL